jgi:hypothetical protein
MLQLGPLLSFLVMIFLIFLETPFAMAERVNQPTTVLIVADHSNSMHGDTSQYSGLVYIPTHMTVQTTAIASAVANHLASCTALTLGYIMYGQSAKPPIWVNLDEGTARSAFVESLQTELSRIDLNTTNHQAGWMMAVDAATKQDAEVTAIIFITDEPGNEVRSQLPAGTLLYKVGIEADSTGRVTAYLTNGVARGQGTVFSAYSAAELENIIDAVFQDVGMNLCLG